MKDNASIPQGISVPLSLEIGRKMDSEVSMRDLIERTTGGHER